MEVHHPAWWGSRAHITYTMVVFVVLASLDNAALALIPSMVLPVTEALRTSTYAIGFMTGSVILITAVTAVFWGYLGDRTQRKRLLVLGTALWVIGLLVGAGAGGYAQLFVGQLITGVGLGSIASVGFSVISDFIGPARRGLAMSFWGISQGLGGVIGGLLASQLGAEDFRIPMLVLAAAGTLFGILYLFAFDAPRGYREPALASLHERADAYDYRISRRQIPQLFRRRTNLWLVLSGLTAQIAYGSLIWVPTLYTEKVVEQGYGIATSTKVQGIFVAIFQIGGLFAILGGIIGDYMQRRTKSGRALVSAVGIVGAIPFFLLFFWIPLTGLEVTEGAGTVTLIGEVLRNLVTEPAVTLALVSVFVALAFTSADSPNWFALIGDVNLPEHRGTIYGVGNLANGIGRGVGNALVGALAGAIERAFPPPINWAIGLSLFQIFFLPTGWMYWKAAGTSPKDIDDIDSTLRSRAARAENPRSVTRDGVQE